MIRVSGERAERVVRAFLHGELPAPRRASLRSLYHPQEDRVLDEALVLWMPAPQSFTGEDCAEFHIHGGVAVADSLLTALAGLEGVRPAEAGEFSRRAVLNGRMDLTAAEGIADLIDAETTAQQEQAVRQMQGALGALYEEWRAIMTRALAHIEADIEFADEDLPGGLGATALLKLEPIRGAMGAHLAEDRGERLREGVSVAIIGPPNAGKSSLINALSKSDAAIVSSEAGTTRDVVEVFLQLSGVPVRLADTAGLRESDNHIEIEGVRRARQRAENADLRILMTAPDAHEVSRDDLKLIKNNDLWVHNKSDLGAQAAPAAAAHRAHPDFTLSLSTGDGLSDFIAALEAEIGKRYGLADRPVMTRLRHRQALQEALDHLNRAFETPALELAAEDVRLASRALGRITGAVDVEMLLDVVFNDFCIGK